MELKATKAREVDKWEVTDPDILVINGQLAKSEQSTDGQMKAGDFYFVVNDLISEEPNPAPRNWLRRMRWRLFEPKTLRQKSSIYRIVISCPFCGLPILTNYDHIIMSKKPLTITDKISCPYAPSKFGNTHAFEIKEGKITPA